MTPKSRRLRGFAPALRACGSAALCLTLALPSPAFALRQPTVEGAGLEELRQALRVEPGAPPPTHTPRATHADAGLEEPAATPAFLAALAVRLADPNANTRRAAVHAVAALGPAAATPDILAALAQRLADPDADTRRAATRAVDALGSAAATPAFLAALATHFAISAPAAGRLIEALQSIRHGLQVLARAGRPLEATGSAVGVEIELEPPWDEEEVRSVPTTDVAGLMQDLQPLNAALAALPPLVPLGYYWPLHLNLNLSASAAARWTPPLQDAASPLHQLLYVLIAPNNPFGRNDYNLERWAKGALHTIKRGGPRWVSAPGRADAARLELKDPALGAGVDLGYWELLLRFLHRVVEQEDLAAVTRHLKAVQAIYAELATSSDRPAFFLLTPGTSVAAARAQLQAVEQIRDVGYQRDGTKQDLGGVYEVEQTAARAALARYMRSHLAGSSTSLTTGLEERPAAMARTISVVRDAVNALTALPTAPAAAAGSPVLVFVDPQLFDLALVAARAGRPVAVRSDGEEAQRLRALRDALIQHNVALGPFAIGRTEVANLLLEYDQSVPIETRTTALLWLGLREDDLPPAVAQALTATRTYLDLAVGA